MTAGGAYIRIKDGKIELHAPGKISIKGGSHDWSGPASMGIDLQGFPSSDPHDEQFGVKGPDGKVLRSLPFQLSAASGAIQGVTEQNGKAFRTHSKTEEPIKFELLWAQFSDVEKDK
jgi:type VI secretion system secreted protein VgrG